MSFSDTVFLFFLALVLFGPKKLPEMARQAGRLLAELRRASNEFRSQIETEIAHLELEKKQNAAPLTPVSTSLNPGAAQETIARQVAVPASLAATSAQPVAADANTIPSAAPVSSATVEPVAEPNPSASRESHA